MKKFDYELIVCIVNSGFSETVMDAAKSVGATGGTIINAKGTANKEAEAFFKIFIQPEKEMVMILVPARLKDGVLHALYKAVGLDTPGQGIAFALPVDNVVGLSNGKPQIEKEEPKAKPEDEPQESDGEEK